MPLFFQMNIDKDLSKNDLDMDDDLLYNFMNATSQLMRNNDVAPWRTPHKKNKK